MQGQFSDISDRLESWYARDNGQYLLDGLTRTLTGLLDTTFGYHLLQLAPLGVPGLGNASPINHRTLCSPAQLDGVGLIANWEELPLESDSVDALIAMHCLEFTAKPHQALREMQRVLTPQGRLVIIGFNPYSLLGISNRVRGLAASSLWHCHRPLGESRVADWLHLLGCEVESRQRLYALPPFGGRRLRRYVEKSDGWCNRHNLPVGGLYLLHAVKQVGGLNRPQAARRRARLIDLAVPKPAAVPTPTPVSPARRDGEGNDAA
ncbi:MAG: methyltransferase domain-containing protein [Pseudomonadota bacterium]